MFILHRPSHRIVAVVAAIGLLCCAAAKAFAAPYPLLLRYQTATSEGSDRYHQLQRYEEWNPSETAIIVCDMWDLHHCLNAVRRVQQIAPRLNDVLRTAREQGVTIIHSPSDCMEK